MASKRGCQRDFHAEHCSSQWHTSSTSPLSHSLQTRSSLFNPCHLAIYILCLAHNRSPSHGNRHLNTAQKFNRTWPAFCGDRTIPHRGHLNPVDDLAGTYWRVSKSSRCLHWHYVDVYFLCYMSSWYTISLRLQWFIILIILQLKRF